MKECTIPCHDSGHINVMVVLQSCTDSLQFLPGSSSETFPTSSNGPDDVRSIEVEEDVVVLEEGFIVINKEAAVHIKQEEIPGDITFPVIKSEPEEVSYVCVCMLLYIIHQYPEMSDVFAMQIFLETATQLKMKMFYFDCLFWWVGVDGDGWEGLY